MPQQEITDWLNGHLQRGQYDSDYLILKLDGTTTYRIFNTESAIELFKAKCVRRILRALRGKVSNRYPDVRRLRPQGVKFWANELARLLDKSEYRDLSNERRVELIAMATRNIEIIQNQGKEKK